MDNNSVLNKWNQKWKEFISSQKEGEHRLKLLVDFGEDGIQFLEQMTFITVFLGRE